MAEEKKTLQRVDEVKRCFIKKGEDIRFHDEKYNLPKIPHKYEEVLLKKNIDYNVVTIERKKDIQDFCQYWDKFNYEEVEVELPLYEYKGSQYTLVGTHKGLVPTKNSVIAAWNIKAAVDEEIAEIKHKRNIESIKEAMQNEVAVYVRKGQIKANLTEGKYDNYRIFINRRENGSYSSDMIVFDLDKIEKNGEVELCLPDWSIKRVLGENNTNAKRWVNELGINKLKVIPIY